MAKVNKNDIKLFKITWLQIVATNFIDMYSFRIYHHSYKQYSEENIVIKVFFFF